LEEIIIKYLISGELSEQELKSLNHWLKTPTNVEKFKELVKINEQLNINTIDIDLKKAYQTVDDKVKRSNKVIKMKPYKMIFKYAAIAVIFVSISFGVYSNFNEEKDFRDAIVLEVDGIKQHININSEKTVLNKKDEIVATITNEILEFIQEEISENNSSNIKINVPNGKIIKLKLSDGTFVTVNSASKIRFASVFPKDKRNVSLEGEAYFDVKRNEQAPFVVSTKDMDIRVLGTRFDVSSYNNDNISFVALEEGSVAVNKPFQDYKEKESLIIKPGEQVVVENDDFRIKETNIEKDIAWVKRQLYFNNDRFEDIIKKLERYYNVKIENKSQDLNNTRYTGAFENETIVEVFTTFNELSEFNYKVLGKKIIITKK